MPRTGRVDDLFNIEAIEAQINKTNALLKGVASELSEIAISSNKIKLDFASVRATDDLIKQFAKLSEANNKSAIANAKANKLIAEQNLLEEKLAKAKQSSALEESKAIKAHTDAAIAQEKLIKNQKERLLIEEKLANSQTKLSNQSGSGSPNSSQDRILKERAKLQQKLNDLENDEIAINYKLREQISMLQRKRKAEVVTVEQVTDSINALEKEVAILTMKYDLLSKEEKQAASGRQLQQKIHDLNKEIREEKVLLSNMKANVGNYRESLDGIGVSATKTGGLMQRMRSTTSAALSKASGIFVDWRMKFAAMSAAISGTIYTIWRWIKMNASLSDSMAAVRRTTQMTNEEVYNLNETLRNLDTRTSQASLLDLAHVAGKLGIAKDEIAGFVKAADMIGVALGKDLGNNEEAINQLGRIVQLFKLSEGGVGMEKALLKTGSALKDLGNASVAEEVNIIDFTKRLGGVAPIANVSADKVMALAATFDILGQTTEVASTATSAIWVGMAQRTERYAKIAGMSVKDFSDLMKKDFNEAFIAVAKGLQKNEAGFLELAQQFQGLGIEGRRVVAVMGALSGSTELYREQMKLSKESFDSGTTAAQQFAIQNETVGASLDKATKALKNLLANEGTIITFTGFIQGLANAYYYLGEALEFSGKVASIPLNLLTGKGFGFGKEPTDPRTQAYRKADNARIRQEQIDIKTMTLLPVESQVNFVKKHKDIADSYLHLWEKARNENKKEEQSDYATRYNLAKQHYEKLKSLLPKEKQIGDLSGKTKEQIKAEKAIEDAYKRLEKKESESQKRLETINNRADRATEKSYQLRVEMGMVSIDEQEKHEIEMLEEKVNKINESATEEMHIYAGIQAEKESWSKKKLDDELKRIDANQAQQIISYDQLEEMKWGIYLKYAKLRGEKEQEQTQASIQTLNDYRDSIKDTGTRNTMNTISFVYEQKGGEMADLRSQLEKRTITVQEYKRREAEINEKYDRQILEASISMMEWTVFKLKETGADTLSLEKQLADMRIALSDKTTAIQIENAQKREEAEIRAARKSADKMREYSDMAVSLIGEIGGLYNTLYDNQIAKIDAKIDANKDAWDEEINAAQGNEKLQKQIDTRRRNEEKRLEKERKKAMSEQAEAQKVIGAIQIGINTAIGATAQFQAGPAGIALAAIVIALGAAQLATLLAYDVPQYSQGREGGPAEFAIVGEKGKEAIVTREGEIYETPNSPTFTFLPMGSTVIPHEEWIQTAAKFTEPTLSSSNVPNYTVNFTDRYGMEMLKELRKKKIEPRIIDMGTYIIEEQGNHRILTRK